MTEHYAVTGMYNISQNNGTAAEWDRFKIVLPAQKHGRVVM